MFGYIVANRKELGEEQAKTYQSYYCGLCQSLKNVVGAKGQLLLNYDMTFLALLLCGLYEPESEMNDFTCPVHPLTKKNAVKNDIMDYCAKMNVLLSYYKLMDDWNDNRSVIKKTMMMGLTKDYKRISKEYPEKEKAIKTYIDKLSVAESGNETNIDAVSGLTGEMMAEIFDIKPGEWSADLRTLAFYLGKYIYLLDAYLDMEKDRKKGLYNIFNSRKELKLDDEKDFDAHVKLILNSMMAESSKSFERLPIVTHVDILRNIIYSGVWTKYEIGKRV